MEQVITQLAFKILFDDSLGFDEMRRTIILPEKQKLSTLYLTWVRIRLEYLHMKGAFILNCPV